MLKKVLSAALLGALVVSVVAGCNPSSTQTSSTAPTSSKGTESQADVDLADKTEKLTISWSGWPNTTPGEPDSWIEKMLEEKYNIELNCTFYDTNAYKQKRPIDFSSGAIPDVIYQADNTELARDVKQGFISELSYDMLKKYSPEFVKLVNEYAPEAWIGTSIDGKNYGIPTTRVLSNYTSNASLWREDWLKNVGIDKVPETIDEMHEAFVRFTKNDPDKNGKNDTYGLSGDMTAWYFTFTEIFGAFGVQPYNWTTLDDGSVVNAVTLPETKEALKMLAEWYKEGIIHPDFVTDQTNVEVRNRFVNGEIGYTNAGSTGYFDTDNANSALNQMLKINPDVKLVATEPIKGKDGQQGRFAWGAIGNIMCFGKDMADRPNAVARILDMWNDMLSDKDFYLESKCGKLGLHFEWIDPAVGSTSGFKYIAPYDDNNTRAKEVLQSDVTYVSYFSPSGGKPELFNSFRKKFDVDFAEEYMNPKFAMKDTFLKGDLITDADKYLVSLREKQMTFFTEVIRGDKSIDDYDAFLADWKASGGDILTENANNLGEKRAAIYKELGIE